MSDIRPFAEPSTPAQWVRPRPFRVLHVDLTVTIDLEHERVEGVVEHTVQWLAHGGRRDLIEFDQEGLELGAVTVDGKTIIAVSPQSPLGNKLLGRQVGFVFEINGTPYAIESVV